MNTSLEWIKSMVPGLECSAQEYMDAMTLSGSKVEGYEQLDADLDKIVIGQITKIEKHPDADMIVFSMECTKNGSVFRKVFNKDGRLGLKGGLKNGTCVFSVRRESLAKANIWFSTLFGGGTAFAHGEDTLFFLAARRKMRIYGSSYSLGYCAKDTSTCFSGYNEKYFFDQGVLYAAAFGRLAFPMALQFCIRKRKKYGEEMDAVSAFREMKKGIAAYNG